MMRKLWVGSIVAALWMVGCSGFDAVGACEDRCERRIAQGCESAGIDCQNTCVLADDIYESNLERAENAGCVGEYQAYVSCLANTPPCATDTVIAEMCAEEALILDSCW